MNKLTILLVRHSGRAMIRALGLGVIVASHGVLDLVHEVRHDGR